MRGRDTRGTPVPSGMGRWTPVRDGDRYCSPACGLGCKWQAYLDATAAADDLCRMLGEGWKPVVWENLGWHFNAERGGVTVRYYAGNSGGAPPHFDCSYDGPGRQFSAESATSPNAAVAEVRRLVEDEALRRGLVTLVAGGPGMSVPSAVPASLAAPASGLHGHERGGAVPAMPRTPSAGNAPATSAPTRPRPRPGPRAGRGRPTREKPAKAHGIGGLAVVGPRQGGENGDGRGVDHQGP